MWDGCEKFYDYTKWLEIIIEKFMKPIKVKVTGKVRFQGEDLKDAGYIKVVNGKVKLSRFK